MRLWDRGCQYRIVPARLQPASPLSTLDESGTPFRQTGSHREKPNGSAEQGTGRPPTVGLATKRTASGVITMDAARSGDHCTASKAARTGMLKNPKSGPYPYSISAHANATPAIAENRTVAACAGNGAKGIRYYRGRQWVHQRKRPIERQTWSDLRVWIRTTQQRSRSEPDLLEISGSRFPSVLLQRHHRREHAANVRPARYDGVWARAESPVASSAPHGAPGAIRHRHRARTARLHHGDLSRRNSMLSLSVTVV